MRTRGMAARIRAVMLVAALVWAVQVATVHEAVTAGPPPFRILLTNDDGIRAEGLEALARALPAVGEVTVVAPAENQSGIGNAIEIVRPIFITPVKMSDAVSGTAVEAPPATCVQLAVQVLLKDRPDLVVSGVNRGNNLGLETYISGTVGAARQAAVLGIPSMAVSLDLQGHPHYEAAAAFTVKLVEALKRERLPKAIFLNVSVPPGAIGSMKGVQIVRQSRTTGHVTYQEQQSPSGRRYFWNVYRPNAEDEEGTDVWAVSHGFIAVTPLHVGEQDDGAMKTLAGWGLTP